MRLQLSATLALMAGAAATAAAEPASDQATATLRLYADDDRVTVVSPAARVAATAGPLGLDLDLTVDAISAASVDVVTSASPVTVEEQRLEAGAGLRLALGRTLTARAGASASHEADHDALRAALGLAVELADRNTTLEGRLRVGHDRAGDVTDPTFAAARDTIGVVATATQLVDRRTVLDVTVDVQRADGWHASPYRRVAVAMDVGPLPTWVREATPARRDALAAALRLRRAVGDGWFATAAARGYVDDWDVASATATVEVVRERHGGTLWGLTARGYVQRAAAFWARRYDGAPAPLHRTADRALGPMASASVALTLDRPLVRDGARLQAALGGMALWFDAVSQRRRLAVTGTISLAWPL